MGKIANMFFKTTIAKKRQWGEEVEEKVLTPRYFNIAAAITLGIAGLFVVFGSWFIVSPGNTGVITRLGSIQSASYKEGIHLKLPLIESSHEINTKIRVFKSEPLDASSSDIQKVTSSAAITYIIPETSVVEVFRNYRTLEALENQAIIPAIEETMKAVTSRYTAEQLITKREIVRNEIISLMRNKLKPHYVALKDVSLTQFDFSKTFNDAIEEKVKAEQMALTEENRLETVKFQAMQSVEKAKAEAESIRIQAEAIKAQGGAEYVQLKYIEKWDGKLPVYGEVPKLFRSVN